MNKIKFAVTINSASTIDEVPEYWSVEDYVSLLDKFNFPDAEKTSKETLRELLFMAITDFEPNEAAALVLEYKLSDHLNEGQIQQISHDMLLDKISEEYADISLHATMYHVNQLLFKAFNGKFPSTKATRISCSIIPLSPTEQTDYPKEKILRLLNAGLSDSNLIKRLFAEPMAGNKPFPEAESILWESSSADNKTFQILTSDYWLSKDDLTSSEFEAVYIEEEQAV